MASRLERFSERARLALKHAEEEAQRFNHSHVGTEHVLLGLVHETNGVAARVLGNLGVELHKVRAAVEFLIGKGDRPVTSDNIDLTSRAKKVIELAVDEARRLNHHYISTAHLLIGLMRESEGEGVAAGVLESFGVTLDKVRAEVTRLLSQSQTTIATRQVSHKRGAELVQRLLTDAVVSAVLQVLREQRSGLDSKTLQDRAEDLVDGRIPALNLEDTLRELREYGVVEEQEQKWRLTELGASFLQRVDEFYEAIGRMLP